MMWIFAVAGLIVIVVIGLVIVGGETARLAAAPRPAVVDLADAVDYIADRLPADTQARISHDDVRWVLLADADMLEQTTADPNERPYPWSRRPRPAEAQPDAVVEPPHDGADAEDLPVVDEDRAVARIIGVVEGSGRDLEDHDIAAVLALRLEYLQKVGAVGAPADDTEPGAEAGGGAEPESDAAQG